MNIRADDIKSLSEFLARELDAGNQWTVYEAGHLHARFENAVHFQNRDDATQYIIDNTADAYDFDLIASQPLYNALMELSIADIMRNDIAYYEINKISFDVSRVLYSNPDQNQLLNPDGNWFTDELISHIERHKENFSGKFSEVGLNFDLLRSQLTRQGYNSECFLTLEASMLKGAAKHEERYFSHYDTETIMSDHVFIRNSKGNYFQDKVTGTLYSHKDIDHTTINGINTQELENKMLFIDLNRDGRALLKEYGPIFQQLCDDPGGRVIAVQLFNNNVPLWWDKPDFISGIENELKIYPKMDFPGETTRIQMYEGLKSYQEISIALREYEISDAQDEKGKVGLIEKLVNGQVCTLVAPSGPHQGKEVFLSWDWMAKVLSFIFKEQLKTDARQYFTKTNSTELIPKLRMNGDNKGKTL